MAFIVLALGIMIVGMFYYSIPRKPKPAPLPIVIKVSRIIKR
jgi:hypothetical protein